MQDILIFSGTDNTRAGLCASHYVSFLGLSLGWCHFGLGSDGIVF